MSKAKDIQKESPVMQKLIQDAAVDVKIFKPGDVVEGVVISTNHSAVLLDVGAKSEGIITTDEFSGADEVRRLSPGDALLAIVVQAENDQGYLVLSLKRAEKERRWRDVELAYKQGVVVDVSIVEYNKGGLLVDYLGLRGFVPLSHLDRVHFADNAGKFATGNEAELKESLKVLSGKVLKVKIIEFDKEKNRLVFSEKDAAFAYSPQAKEEKLAKVVVGSTLEGIVTGIMPFGIFVDLDGIEGLVHISEIAWEKVNRPGDYYSVGMPIKVKVLGVDERERKLALSVKQLANNPWEGVEGRYPVGAKVKGKVSKVVPFGAFVTLEKGFDGLIHISEAAGPLEEGQVVEAVVTNVDAQNQKLALSMR